MKEERNKTLRWMNQISSYDPSCYRNTQNTNSLCYKCIIQKTWIYNRPDHVTAGFSFGQASRMYTLHRNSNQCTNEGTVCRHLRIRGDRDVPRSAFSPFNFKWFSRKNCQIDGLTPPRKKSRFRHCLDALLIWEDFLLMQRHH